MTDPLPAIAAPPKPARLVSLDAYRGIVMLAMASSGLSIAAVLNNPKYAVLTRFDGTRWEWLWQTLWRRAAYQLEHVAWTGCSFWDLIQPSFMFMVGVALPFSFSRRAAEGQSQRALFGHALLRALILVLLGVFLSTRIDQKVTHFTFVNVLTQIGLGYPVLWLLRNSSPRMLLVHAAVILAGYWGAFALCEIPRAEFEEVTQYLREVKHKDEAEWTQFSGFASHWNKHTNFAAAVDRRLLNVFPRNEEPWHGRQFWINDGGYQTLNFIPSLATMIFGLIAGKLLFAPGEPRRKVRTLFVWGAGCFLVAMAADTTIWPVQFESLRWTLCPAVKRIWTPTWTVFSTGWCFWMLAAFYAVIDVRGWKRWAFPLAIVGMNSIAIYCMAQLMKGWLLKTLIVHSGTVDAVFHTRIVPALTGEPVAGTAGWSAPILQRVAEVALLWLILLWMYRRRIFIRI